MTTLVARLTDIQDRLDALARRHHVPGAVLAIARDDELLEFSTGVVNVDTGVETTTDSIFRIGSNTKLFTTTLVMQLVDEGRVDLDAPVRQYLPAFRLARSGDADQITVRQLLTHTSGIQGDHFEGFGRGDDAVERYVASLGGVDLVHPAGQLWSYCNSGFVLAGHLVEQLTGSPFRVALRERICRPLGLHKLSVLPEEMLASRCAVGHVVLADRRPVVPKVGAMEYALVPAGSMAASTAAELVRFVQMHLDGGVAPGGERVLSTDAVLAMQEVQFKRPPFSTTPLTQGLGWAMDEWDGKRAIGHEGVAIGQLSFLQAIPGDRLVVALLTNATTGGALWLDLGRWLFEELAGVRMGGPPKAPAVAPDIDLERYAGTYERLGARYRIEADGDALVMHIELSGSLRQLQGVDPPPARLRAIDRERFAGRVQGVDTCVVFLEFARGRPRYVVSTSRVARRVRDRTEAKSPARVGSRAKPTSSHAKPTSSRSG